MRRINTLILFFITAIFISFAHDADSDKREKMFREVREFKMKYLAQEMSLQDSQKKKFFELYDELSSERDKIYQPVRELERKIRHDKDASEEDYQKVTEAMNDANAKYAEVEKEYDARFAEFLSQKQIYKMKDAEKNFRAKLEEMRHERKKHKK